MKTSEIAALIGADTVHTDWDDREFSGACTSDLLSDAMANAPEEGILITIQAHKNTVAVGTLKDLAAIVVCSDRPIPDDMIAAARAERIAIFVTAESQFTVSGILYAQGVR
jgi:hypothetical protein